MTRRILLSLLCFSVSCFAQVPNPLPTYWAGVTLTQPAVPISASAVIDAKGTRVKNGNLCFTPVDGNDKTIGFLDAPAQIMAKPVCGLVSNGVLAAGMSLAPTPDNVYYHPRVYDRTTGALLRDFCMVQITGSSWTLDTFACATVIPPGTIVIQGPPGPPGPAGSSGGSGNWISVTANTTANCGDFIRDDASGPIAITLPAVPSSGGCDVAIMRGPAAGVPTIAPPAGVGYDGTSQAGAAANAQLPQGEAVYIRLDTTTSTGYHGTAPIIAGTHCTITPALTGNIFDCSDGPSYGPTSGSQAIFIGNSWMLVNGWTTIYASSYSCTSGTCTVQAVNNYVAGQTIAFQGGTPACLAGTATTVASATKSQFVVSGTTCGTASGSATTWVNLPSTGTITCTSNRCTIPYTGNPYVAGQNISVNVGASPSCMEGRAYTLQTGTSSSQLVIDTTNWGNCGTTTGTGTLFWPNDTSWPEAACKSSWFKNISCQNLALSDGNATYKGTLSSLATNYTAAMHPRVASIVAAAGSNPVYVYIYSNDSQGVPTDMNNALALAADFHNEGANVQVRIHTIPPTVCNDPNNGVGGNNHQIQDWVLESSNFFNYQNPTMTTNGQYFDRVVDIGGVLSPTMCLGDNIHLNNAGTQTLANADNADIGLTGASHQHALTNMGNYFGAYSTLPISMIDPVTLGQMTWGYFHNGWSQVFGDPYGGAGIPLQVGLRYRSDPSQNLIMTPGGSNAFGLYPTVIFPWDASVDVIASRNNSGIWEADSTSIGDKGGSWLMKYLYLNNQGSGGCSGATTSGQACYDGIHYYIADSGGVQHDVLAAAGGGTFTPSAIQFGTDATHTRAATAGDLANLSYVADTGTGAAYVATLPVPVTSYVPGLTVTISPANPNSTTAPTLNVNGLGPKPITKNGSLPLAVSTDILAGVLATFKYDGTNFQLQNPQTSSSSSCGGTIPCTNTANTMTGTQTFVPDVPTHVAGVDKGAFTAAGSPTSVQNGSAYSTGGGITTLAFGSSVTAGNTLVVGLSGTGTPSDTMGNTFTLVGTQGALNVYTATAITSGSDTVTGSFNTTSAFISEWSGLQTSLDGSAAGMALTNTTNTLSITTSQTDMLMAIAWSQHGDAWIVDNVGGSTDSFAPSSYSLYLTLSGGSGGRIVGRIWTNTLAPGTNSFSYTTGSSNYAADLLLLPFKLAGISQSADLRQFQASDGTVLSAVDNKGRFRGAYGSSETVPYSATPTFSITVRASIMSLTGNVSSFTLAAGIDGQEKTLCFVQDATGSHTVAGPSNVKGLFTVGSTASKTSCQHFTYNAALAAWYADSAGVTNQ
jgi:lysophospholipase L1-like esterase